MMGWDSTTWIGAIFTLVVMPVLLWLTVWMDGHDDDDSGMS